MTRASSEVKYMNCNYTQASFPFSAHVVLSLHYWYSLLTPRPVESFITAKVRNSLILITTSARHSHTNTGKHTHTRAHAQGDGSVAGGVQDQCRDESAMCVCVCVRELYVGD